MKHETFGKKISYASLSKGVSKIKVKRMSLKKAEAGRARAIRGFY